ncbi:DUF7453 family protein [Bythopirellula goksoeyrii]|uniref:PEP-CTERM protein-sorting domain-containing protein n=1 Tax=Bythopirellula goksoeyrii TaxID=1400387 RepID=A0A5B9QAE5_9BACT|nr:choice-of-anchor tandem repeat NxxGxxAF-containing protein [Bythopirellula goksoeyrii]QEG34570.1 hypothetical protein Pr1d_18510 [Bythopirellula goksoeyrii]
MLFSSLSSRTYSITVTMACSLCLTPIAQADGDLRTVVLTGDQAPGADPGVVFSSFPSFGIGAGVPPMIDAMGQTAFFGQLTGPGVNSTNDDGIYSEGKGTLAEVARKGDQAPGADSGVVFSGLRSPVLSAAGQTAFGSFLAGPGVSSTNGIGIYIEGGHSLFEVARAGNQAPGADPGSVFSGLSFLNLSVLNTSGHTAFSGTLTGMGVNSTNGIGIYSGGNGSLAEVARAGDQAHGADPGIFFSSFELPLLNATGQTVFIGVLAGPGVNSNTDSAIYKNEGVPLTEVIREGNQAPGADPGVVFSGFNSNLGISSVPVLNAAGQTAFFGVLTGPGVNGLSNTGIYSEGRGPLTEVARAGNPAPGASPGVVFSSFFSDPVINSTGQTAFQGRIRGPGVFFNEAIYSEGSGTLAEVAREDNQVPGANPGVTFSHFDLGSLVLNGAGQTAFSAYLSGSGVSFANDLGIYATTRDGLLIEIVREGDLIDVNDDPLIDDLRTISLLSVLNKTGNEDGRASSFNDHGQLAFRATFTDGTEGIFVSNRVAIPEPTTAALLALCLSALIPRRHSK